MPQSSKDDGFNSFLIGVYYEEEGNYERNGSSLELENSVMYSV